MIIEYNGAYFTGNDPKSPAFRFTNNGHVQVLLRADRLTERLPVRTPMGGTNYSFGSRPAIDESSPLSKIEALKDYLVREENGDVYVREFRNLREESDCWRGVEVRLTLQFGMEQLVGALNDSGVTAEIDIATKQQLKTLASAKATLEVG